MDFLLTWLKHTGVSVYASAITLVIFLIMFRRLNAGERWVGLVIIIYSFTEIVANFMAVQKIPNLWWYNIMLIPQFMVVITALHNQMNSRKLKRIFSTGCLLISIFHLTNIMLYQGVHNFANFTYVPACGWMAACAFFYLREQMELVEMQPFRNLVFWFAFATLIDNAGTMPVMAVLGWTDYINTTNAGHLWKLVTWLYAFWYLIILTGLLWTKTSLRSVLYSR